MRINVIGGGPAGLYFAFLAKRDFPSWTVRVFEQNPADATYGFGVVFSDLAFLEGLDTSFFDTLFKGQEAFTDMAFIHKGKRIALPNNRFYRVARIELLRVLQENCRSVGVEMTFGRRIERDHESLPEADLVVGADGINSHIRTRYAAEFGAHVDQHRNKWAWFATPALFRDVTLTFLEHEHGTFIGHSYQYADDRSGFVVEVTPETWKRAGLDRRDDVESAAYCSEVFRDLLGGKPLLSNRSVWFNTQMVINERWSHGNIVLIGDAARTVHPSLGAGTRTAMRDSVYLMRALKKCPEDLPTALAAYEQARRPKALALQEAAIRSVAWYESVESRMHLAPEALAYSYMMRTGRVSHEDLRVRDPDLVEAYERHLGLPAREATVAVVYHSGKGHTARQAKAIGEGALRIKGVRAHLIPVDEAETKIDLLAEADAIVMGSPTYLGSVSADFKKFMEATSGIWIRQGWKGKLAAGFTTSGNQSGDKLATLQQMAVFAAQHGMLWVPLAILGGNNSSTGSPEDLNRLGVWLGAAAQANMDQGAEVAPPEADLETARVFGSQIAEAALRYQRPRVMAAA